MKIRLATWIILVASLLFSNAALVPLGTVTTTNNIWDTNWVLISSGTGDVRRIVGTDFQKSYLRTWFGQATNLLIYTAGGIVPPCVIWKDDTLTASILDIRTSDNENMVWIDKDGVLRTTNSISLQGDAGSGIINLTGGVITNTAYIYGTNQPAPGLYIPDALWGVSRSKRWAMWTAHGASTPLAIGEVGTLTGTGAGVAPTATTPTGLNISAAAAGTNALTSQASGYWMAKSKRFHAYVKLDTTNTTKYFIGFTSATTANMMVAGGALSGHVMGIRWWSDGTDATLKAVTRDGATTTVKNLNVVPVTTTWYRFDAIYTAGVDVKFYINGAYVTNSAANLPGAATGWFALMHGDTDGAFSSSISRAYWEEEQ